MNAHLCCIAVLVLSSDVCAQTEAESVQTFVQSVRAGRHADFNADGRVSQADIIDYIEYLRSGRICNLHRLEDGPRLAEVDRIYHSAPWLLEKHQPELLEDYLNQTRGPRLATHLELEAFQERYGKQPAASSSDGPDGDPTVGIPSALPPLVEAVGAGSIGHGMVWPRTGPIDWSSGTYNYVQQQQATLYNLGKYDANGARIGGNNGLLRGKYLGTNIIDLSSTPPYDPVYDARNDFRFDYRGDPAFPAQPHEAIGWSTEVNAYHHIDTYRRLYLNEAFVSGLVIDADTRHNLLHRQYRPDLVGLTWFDRPVVAFFEAYSDGITEIDPRSNGVEVLYRLRYGATANLPPLSKSYDPELTVGEYAGLVAFWVIGDNRGFPSELGFGEGSGWYSNIAPALNDALNYFEAARYSGKDEVFRYNAYAKRIWREIPCDGDDVPCGKGINIDNVMMYRHGDLSKDLIFPFRGLPGMSPEQGPAGADLSGMYFAAIFRDIAREAGLGMTRAGQLFWQMLYLIDNRDAVPMVEFGNLVISAARVLWPSSDLAGPHQTPPGQAGEPLSLYEQDIDDILTSRGIPTYGRASIQEALPPAIGVYPATLENESVNRFGSSHPETHPGIAYHGERAYFWNGYHHDVPAEYMAFQTWRLGGYGPCDELRLTDGTFSSVTGEYNEDGSYFRVLTGNEIANKIILAPGRIIRWSRVRGRCVNEYIGNYAEDVRPFGFRTIKATADGFAFKVQFLGQQPGFMLNHRFTIVDPSYAALGGTYMWTFTDYSGVPTHAQGFSVDHAIRKDEPFTIEIKRIRGTQEDELVMRTRSTDLARDGGNAHLINLLE